MRTSASSACPFAARIVARWAAGTSRRQPDGPKANMTPAIAPKYRRARILIWLKVRPHAEIPPGFDRGPVRVPGKRLDKRSVHSQKSPMSSFETLLVDQADGVVTITINRPAKLNALNAQVLTELTAVLTALAQDPGDARVGILTGAGGKAFVAGADIAEMQKMTASEAKRFSELGQGVTALLEALPFPIIAKVSGFALGGGCELALACDFIYASSKSKFGQPEVNLGLIPGFGGTARLARRIGLGHARELIYTGDIIRADRAQAIGLVNQILEPEELDDAVQKLAGTIASRGPRAVRECKRVMLRGTDADLGVACELEAQAFSALFACPDQQEGASAFLEKRAAVFKGE